MRSDVAGYSLSAPPDLEDVLSQLAAEPGRHTLIAGGTELMVALNTGRLAAQSLLSIQHLRELRFIHAEEGAIRIGAGSTFTDIRRHAAIACDLPLLVQAASWTGSIANQNRGTLGGNLCNASPAADTPPALLAYGATLTLRSIRGERIIDYRDFHLGYKRTALEADEIAYSVTVPVPGEGSHQYLRKVGTRKAQAIAKVALAVVARVQENEIAEIRIGAASIADRPLRCVGCETALRGTSIEARHRESTIRSARAALAREAHPIDDIRSTARYRRAVAENLIEEFLRSLPAR